jgi:hypothetical protein
MFTAKLQHRQRWGFVIYRTDYSSEADWTKFLAMFATWSLYAYPDSESEYGRLVRSWQQHCWMNDKSQFDGATPEQLRQHFQLWAASQNSREQLILPESFMFFVVDKDVLDNIRPQNPEVDSTPRDETPYVKVIDKDRPDEGEEYPGWMNMPLMNLLHMYIKGLSLETMRGLRPRHFDWYRGSLPEKDTYLEEDDESESSLSWASEPEGGGNATET